MDPLRLRGRARRGGHRRRGAARLVGDREHPPPRLARGRRAAPAGRARADRSARRECDAGDRRFWFKSGTQGARRRAFELATDGPASPPTRTPAHLGETLVLPPWLEHRAADRARAAAARAIHSSLITDHESLIANHSSRIVGSSDRRIGGSADRRNPDQGITDRRSRSRQSAIGDSVIQDPRFGSVIRD